MSEDKRDDLLRKVSGLIAKAESTDHEGERAVFMAKADELMNKYRIELWEIQQRNTNRIDERKPTIKDFDFSFAFNTGPFPEICDALWGLFLGCVMHANCVAVTHKQHFSGENRTTKYNTMPIIGTESDLGYLELLFTSLLMQLVSEVRPKYDKTQDYFQNLKKFREAGWSWDEVGKVVIDAGESRLPDEPFGKQRDKMIRDYRSWCKRTGTPQNYANYKTYRRNFADGYVAKVRTRMSEMRSNQSGSTSGGGMEIALRDQREVNTQFMMDEFPRPRSQALARGRADNRKFDSSAFNGGTRAGEKANLSNPNSGLKGRKAIES
jgi:hypothetical protein